MVFFVKEIKQINLLQMLGFIPRAAIQQFKI